ncbi:MAG: MGMT family protein [Anaerolineales bacterium]|nr:MGMT family protein [Anaerolineales bacterium]
MKAYNDRVYWIVRQVPAGKVTTYGQVAGMIPPPPGVLPQDYGRIRAQWVGRAMRTAPQATPWHRVINSRGQISLPAGSRSASIQRLRLEAEGIRFNRNGQINLNKFGWDGPEESLLKEQNLLPARPLSTRKQIQPPLF